MSQNLTKISFVSKTLILEFCTVEDIKIMRLVSKKFNQICKISRIKEEWKCQNEKLKFFVFRNVKHNPKRFTLQIRVQMELNFSEKLLNFVKERKLTGYGIEAGNDLFDITLQGNFTLIQLSLLSLPFKCHDSNQVLTRMKYKSFQVLDEPLQSKQKGGKLILDPYDSSLWTRSSLYSISNQSE